MDVSLAANHFVPNPPFGVGDAAEEKHALLKFLLVCLLADVHCDGVNGIRPLGLGIAKAGTNRIERAQLGSWAEAGFAVLEAEWLGGRPDVEPRIEVQWSVLTDARIVAHFRSDCSGRTRYFPTAAGTMKVSA